MSRVEEIMVLAEHIPPFPKVAQQVMAMIDKVGTTAKDLAAVIQFDPAITANILKICNAAYFGLQRKVSSLDEALVLIGQDMMKEIIVTSSSARFYKGEAGGGYLLEQGELWRHSMGVAIMARLLVRHVKGVDAGTAFTTGLLHDIGKRFLSAFVASDFAKIMSLAHAENGSLIEAEMAVLGASHAQLGAMIMERWGFPPEMAEAVRCHHDPAALEKGPLTALLAISNALVVSMGIGVGAAGLSGRLQGEGLARYGITSSILERYMVELVEEMEKAEELLNL